MVLQFVGFLGAWHQPGNLSPLAAATLGAFITTWVTFAPSFLFILTGAPLVERLDSNPRTAVHIECHFSRRRWSHGQLRNLVPAWHAIFSRQPDDTSRISS